MILDACRDNPLAKSMAARSRSAAGTGLATVSSVSSGMLIAYATAPDKVALDSVGAGTARSRPRFVKHLRTPGLEIRQLLTRVRAEVVAATKKAQVPWDHSSLTGDVYLAGGSKLTRIPPTLHPSPLISIAFEDGPALGAASK